MCDGVVTATQVSAVETASSMTERLTKLDTVEVLGVEVASFQGYDQAVQCVADRLGAAEKTFCVAINPEKIYRAQQDASLKQLLDQADMRICDGVGVALASRVLNGERLERCCGVDLFLHLAGRAATAGWKVFLFGASPESNDGAARRLAELHPELQIVGRRHGYDYRDEDVVEAINGSGAQLVFVAMGSPRQEQWIVAHKDRLNAAFVMGVGGSFDVLSGTAQRAPRLFRRTGTEFLYRLIKEPKRWRRQLALPLFAGAVMRQWWLLRRQGKAGR